MIFHLLIYFRVITIKTDYRPEGSVILETNFSVLDFNIYDRLYGRDN